jgi:hypothetical protein
MKMKDIYTAIESMDTENKTEMVEFLKTKSSDSDTLEAKVRTLESDAKQFEGLDLAKLKTASEFIETSGGVAELQAHIAKSKGYDDNQLTIDAEKKKYSDLEEKHNSDAQKWVAEKERLNLTSEALKHFNSETGFNTPDILLDYAINNGFVVKNDTGLCSVVDGVTTPFSGGGIDKLKEHSTFKGAVRTPNGGNIGGGANGGNTNGNSGGESLEQLFQ